MIDDMPAQARRVGADKAADRAHWRHFFGGVCVEKGNGIDVSNLMNGDFLKMFTINRPLGEE
jgi:hypothetical protein